jgi:hypothetical protein
MEDQRSGVDWAGVCVGVAGRCQSRATLKVSLAAFLVGFEERTDVAPPCGYRIACVQNVRADQANNNIIFHCAAQSPRRANTSQLSA